MLRELRTHEAPSGVRGVAPVWHVRGKTGLEVNKRFERAAIVTQTTTPTLVASDGEME